jgi:putative membrane protein
VTVQLPYCGSAPLPGELLHRFNLDPALMAALIIACAWQLWATGRVLSGARRRRAFAFAGWVIAAAAFISPLCALSVALCSARVLQHMILLLVAAPLLAMGMPPSVPSYHPWRLWAAATAFFLALWYWHMPGPYDDTFASTAQYWAMHITLFGSGVALWRELLDHPPQWTGQVLGAGALTFLHMGLLGAVFALADRPLFLQHLASTQVWGLSPLQDQQLAGSLMWVPGIGFFLWSALRSLAHLWKSVEPGPRQILR